MTASRDSGLSLSVTACPWSLYLSPLNESLPDDIVYCYLFVWFVDFARIQITRRQGNFLSVFLLYSWHPVLLTLLQQAVHENVQ